MSQESTPTPEAPKWMEELQKIISTLKYGTVQLKVHDAQVVLIEKIEQIRFDLNAKTPTRNKAKE